MKQFGAEDKANMVLNTYRSHKRLLGVANINKPSFQCRHVPSLCAFDSSQFYMGHSGPAGFYNSVHKIKEHLDFLCCGAEQGQSRGSYRSLSTLPAL